MDNPWLSGAQSNHECASGLIFGVVVLVVFVVGKHVGLSGDGLAGAFQPGVVGFNVGQVPVCFCAHVHVSLEVHQLVDEMPALGQPGIGGQESHVAQFQAHVVGWFIRGEVMSELRVSDWFFRIRLEWVQNGGESCGFLFWNSWQCLG